MKSIITGVLVFAMASVAFGQDKYFTKNGKITFFSKAPLENIEAVNQKVTAVLDMTTGQVEFAVLMKAFTFEKALMQEHFNENYVESDKFPKATFKGTVENIKSVNLAKPGDYPVTVKGTMTIHGESKEVTTKGTIRVTADQKMNATAVFNILLSDYKISIPAMTKDKISNTIQIDVNLLLETLPK